MPPIPEEVRRRLERQYHPTQILNLDPSLDYEEGPGDSIISTQPTHEDYHHDDTGRSLPKSPITDDNMAEQYAAFILYCNPTIPLDTDTAVLKSIFRAPPRSDGKSFSTWILFELIKKLEAKEIKTWAQLAIDLGVEPPALKGQSAQKVQQYAVRLKRWMHAMHVDSFFEYLMKKPHPYWTQVPSVNESLLDKGRDGVPAEEDLALRALLPETRPKRGRRKNEDREDSELAKSPAQRPRINSPTLSEDFVLARESIMHNNANTAGANTSFPQSFDDRIMPWSAMESRGQLGAFRWPPADHTSTPLSAYPLSAITPSNRNEMWNDEPRSAITPKSRSRRRHGPAVSSAWPSNGTSSGKLRGRPPNNRSVQDGPFSTFPANPTARDTPTSHIRDNTPAATPFVADTQANHFFPPPFNRSSAADKVPQPRPGRLSLQVPQREGGAVRLATPPPVLLVNGEEESHSCTISNGPTFASPMEYNTPPTSNSFQNPTLLNPDQRITETLESYFTSKILTAELITTSNGTSVTRCTPLEASHLSKQIVKVLHSDTSNHETFLLLLLNISALAAGPSMKGMQVVRTEKGTQMKYECRWKTEFESVEGEFVIRAGVEKDAPDDGVQREASHGVEGEESWKQKYLELRQQMREKDERTEKLKKGILEALADADRVAGQ